MRIFLKDEDIRAVSVADADGNIYVVERDGDSKSFIARCQKYPWLSWKHQIAESALEGLVSLVEQVEDGGGVNMEKREMRLLNDG